MIYKAGTVTQMVGLRDKIPKEVYFCALRLATILDGFYGEERNIDSDDGGILVFLETMADVEEFCRIHMRMDGNNHEAVEWVHCEAGNYLNVFYLCNNEFGINVFLPVGIAPKNLLDEVDSGRWRKKRREI